MKKIMLHATLVLTLAMLGFAVEVKADGTLLDQFYAGFVGNAKFAIESTTDGSAHGEFLDNFVEVGSLNGGHLLALDAGVLGTFLPGTNEFRSADWTSGGKVHLAPIIKGYVRVPAGWEFLQTVEIDVRASYNWSKHHPFYGLVAAYPFH